MKDRKTIALVASIVFTPVVALGLYMLWDAEKTRRLRDEKTAQTRRQIADLEANRIAEERAESERRARIAKEEKTSKFRMDPRVAQYSVGRGDASSLEARSSELEDTYKCRSLLVPNLKDPDSYREFSTTYTSKPFSTEFLDMNKVTPEARQVLRNAGIPEGARYEKRFSKGVLIRYSATNSFGARLQDTFACGWNVTTGKIDTTS